MKSLSVLAASLFILSALTFGTAQAQIRTPAASPAATLSQGIGLGKITVEYSRPSLRGRKMFGNQVPYGKVWRTGANKVTNLILSEEMSINGTSVPAGTYGLFTIPNANEWTIIISKDANIWGAYDYKQANDLLRFTVKAQKLSKPEEHFTIAFTDFGPSEVNLALSWEQAMVKFPIKHDADAQIMASIEKETANPNANAGTYMAAANYYFDTNRDLNKAYEWANKVVAQDQKFWTYNLRAKIAAKLGKCDVVRSDSEKGLALATEAGDDSYILSFRKLMKDCGQK